MTEDKRTFRQTVGECIGGASMCWSETPKGVFDSTRASKLCDEIFDAFHLDAGMNVTRWVSVVRENHKLREALHAINDELGDSERRDIPVIRKIIKEALAEDDKAK